MHDIIFDLWEAALIHPPLSCCLCTAKLLPALIKSCEGSHYRTTFPNFVIQSPISRYFKQPGNAAIWKDLFHSSCFVLDSSKLAIIVSWFIALGLQCLELLFFCLPLPVIPSHVPSSLARALQAMQGFLVVELSRRQGDVLQETNFCGWTQWPCSRAAGWSELLSHSRRGIPNGNDVQPPFLNGGGFIAALDQKRS